MKVWFMRAEQGHKSAGDTQFIQKLRCSHVQVYRAKKNTTTPCETPRRDQRCDSDWCRGRHRDYEANNAQTLTLTASRLNSITPPKRQRDGSHSLAD